jgi:hypothetical protein
MMLAAREEVYVCMSSCGSYVGSLFMESYHCYLIPLHYHSTRTHALSLTCVRGPQSDETEMK